MSGTARTKEASSKETLWQWKGESDPLFFALVPTCPFSRFRGSFWGRAALTRGPRAVLRSVELLPHRSEIGPKSVPNRSQIGPMSEIGPKTDFGPISDRFRTTLKPIWVQIALDTVWLLIWTVSGVCGSRGGRVAKMKRSTFEGAVPKCNQWCGRLLLLCFCLSPERVPSGQPEQGPESGIMGLRPRCPTHSNFWWGLILCLWALSGKLWLLSGKLTPFQCTLLICQRVMTLSLL